MKQLLIINQTLNTINLITLSKILNILDKMDNEKIVCHIDEATEKSLKLSFYNKCSGYKINVEKNIKLGSTLLKIPSEKTIESIFYCINSNNKGDRHGILDLYSNKKIIELINFKPHSSFHINEKEGIPKNILRSILPILKAYGYTSIIMRLINNEYYKDIIKSYNSIGIENINSCPYPRFIVDMIDSIASIEHNKMSKILKSPTKVLKLKETIINEWSSNENIKENEIIFVGNVDNIRTKLDDANIPSITNFS
jgi:hypothetical protein